MKRRLGGLIGLAVWVVLVYFIWKHLSGGEGLSRNLARNTLLGLLLPLGIYCLVLLFGSPKAQSETVSGQSDMEKSQPIKENAESRSQKTDA